MKKQKYYAIVKRLGNLKDLTIHKIAYISKLNQRSSKEVHYAVQRPNNGKKQLSRNSPHTERIRLGSAHKKLRTKKS